MFTIIFRDRVGKFMADPIAHTENMPSPRVVKTHLPIEMLPPDLLDTCKCVAVVRNVKDACSSFYHHEQLLPNQGLDKSVDFEDYAEYYMEGKVLYGSYWTITKNYIKHKDHPNLLLLQYEDLRKDLEGCIKKIGEFIGHSVPEGKMEVSKSLTIKSSEK